MQTFSERNNHKITHERAPDIYFKLNNGIHNVDTQNKVLWLHCTLSGIAAYGIFRCHALGIGAFY